MFFMEKVIKIEDLEEDELDSKLAILCTYAWDQATPEERDLLLQAGNVTTFDKMPEEIFLVIAQQAKQLDPGLSTILFAELNVKIQLRRMEINDVPLSTTTATALQFALAYELGRRIDRVLAELGGDDGDRILHTDVEAKAREYGVQWQVIAYALTRKSEAKSINM